LSLAILILALIGYYLTSIYGINHSYYKAHNGRGKVALRKFPYPYKAAMTICSDIDETATAEEFLEIHKFLNTKEMTSMGRGVGLDIGDSFMMYARPTHSFSYYSGDSVDAQVIREFIKTGHIDVMHSYGEKPGFTRKDAIRAIGELIRNDCRISVWVDHSRMTDNLGDDRSFGLGDHPLSTAYHSDITLAYGIEFVWLGRLTQVIGQSAPITLNTFWSIYDSAHPVSSLRNMGKEFAKHVLAVFGNKKYAMHRSYDLVRMVKLDDGRRVYEFLRFDNYWKGVAVGATSKRLAYVISDRTLKRLEKSGGYMIVFTHLGKNSDCNQVIAEETQAALRGLADEYEKGTLYVTTTSKLLNYYLNHKYLNWSYETKGDEIIITISRVEDPVFGPFVPSARDLHGITFYVPDKDKAKVYVGDTEMPNLRRNPQDYSGRESVSIGS
jgi:hypothetical protein